MRQNYRIVLGTTRPLRRGNDNYYTDRFSYRWHPRGVLQHLINNHLHIIIFLQIRKQITGKAWRQQMLQKQYLRKLGKHPKYLPPTVSPPGRSVSRVIYIYIYCCIYSELPARYQCQAYANTKITNNMGLQRYPLFDFKIGLTLIPAHFFCYRAHTDTRSL